MFFLLGTVLGPLLLEFVELDLIGLLGLFQGGDPFVEIMELLDVLVGLFCGGGQFFEHYVLETLDAFENLVHLKDDIHVHILFLAKTIKVP